MAHAFNPSTREAEAEAEAVGFLSLRPARATQRNPVSKNQKKKKKKVSSPGLPRLVGLWGRDLSKKLVGEQSVVFFTHRSYCLFVPPLSEEIR